MGQEQPVDLPDDVSLVNNAYQLTGDGAIAPAVDPEQLNRRKDFDEPQKPPGRGASDPQLMEILGDTGEDAFARELCEMISEYEMVSKNKRDRELELMEYYLLATNALHGGEMDEQPGFVSELMLTTVDQAAARLFDNMTSVHPLPQTLPKVRHEKEDEHDAMGAFAKATGRFMHGFMMNDCNLKATLSDMTFLSCLTGTAVLHPKWVTRNEQSMSYDKDGKVSSETRKVHRIETDVLENDKVICWPPTQCDWQKAELVGHRMFLTKSQWFCYAHDMGLDSDVIDQVMSGHVASEIEIDGDGHERSLAQQGVEESNHLDQTLGRICITQLFGRLALPNDASHTVRHVHVILHEGMGKILRLWKNPYHENQYPYYPIRYKRIANRAWGMGAGDEIIYAQSADSAMYNLQLQNVQNGAFYVHQVKAGSVAAMQMSRLAPNEVLVVDKPGEDLQSTQMGGSAQGIDETVADIRYRARSASGVSSVMSGQGDPVLKSGASVGQTSLLAQQGGKKFGRVDAQFRDDLNDYFAGCLDLVAQYAPNGLYYTHLEEGDAEKVRILRFYPKSGRIRDRVMITCQAPNAESSRESRQSTGMMLAQLSQQHIQFMTENGQILAQDNPAGYQRLMTELIRFHHDLVEQLLSDHDVPGLAAKFPDRMETTPEDQKINELNQQLEQMAMQLQQLMPPEMQEQAPQPGQEMVQ